MDAKEEAKEESKGSSLSREDLLKYIKRLKAKVKGLEDERAQTEKEAEYLKKGYESQKQAWDELYARVRSVAEAASAGAPASSLDPAQLCSDIQTALTRSRPQDAERIKGLEQQNEELRLKCEAAVAVQLDLSAQLQQTTEQLEQIKREAEQQLLQQQQQSEAQQKDVHAIMESLVLELQRLDKWSSAQEYMMQLRAAVIGDEIPPTADQRREREQHNSAIANLTDELQTLQAELVQTKESSNKWEAERNELRDQLASMETQLQQPRQTEAAAIAPALSYPNDLAPLSQPLPSNAADLVQLLRDEVALLKLPDVSRFQTLFEQMESIAVVQQQQLQQLHRIDSVSSMDGTDVLRRNASTDSLLGSPAKPREGADERQELALKMKRLVAKCKKLQEELAAASNTAADATQLAADRDQEIAELKATIAQLQEHPQRVEEQRQQQQHEQVVVDVTRYEQEIQAIQAQLAAVESELANTKDARNRAEDESAALRLKTGQLQAAIDKLQETLAATSNDVNEARAQLAARDQELATLTAALGAANKEQEYSAQSAAQKLAAVQQQLEALQAESADRTASLQAENRQLADQAQDRVDELAMLRASVDELRAALQARETELQQTSKRAQAMEEKAKKLKMLLSKAHNASQERESELSSLRQAMAAPKHVVPQIAVQHGDVMWLLVAPADESGQPLAEGQGMWQTKETVDRWQNQGTQLYGPVPDTLQSMAAAEIAKAKEREQSVTAELAAMRTNFAELEQSFEAYKSRAQAALKRVTREDSNLRRDQYEAEHAKLLSLSEQVAELTRTVDSKSATIEAQDEELAQLREQASMLRSKLSENETARTELAARFRDLSDQEVVMSEKLSDIEARNAQLLVQVKSLSTCLREKEEELRVAHAQVQAAQAVAVVPEIVHPPTPVELRKRESQDNAPESTIESPPASNPPEKRDDTVDGSAGVDTPGAVSESLLLLDQARQDKEEVQELMKSRIQQLTAELVDVREQLLQLHEQNDVLRESIRELDGQLCRERELNSHDRRLNAEYLTNVVKSFLVCDDKDERLRLIPVICHILHFSASEQQEIMGKWSGGGGGGGIIGWTSSLWGGKPKPDDGHKPPSQQQQPKLDPTTLAGFELQI